jgi:hypothetical protein
MSTNKGQTKVKYGHAHMAYVQMKGASMSESEQAGQHKQQDKSGATQTYLNNMHGWTQAYTNEGWHK